MNACIARETFVFTVFRRVFHSTLKLELCRHACRRRDPIISTCRYGKNMPTTALLIIWTPILPVLRWSCPKSFESLRLETESKSKSLTSESKTKTKQSQVLRPRLVSRPPTLGMEGEGKDVRKGSGEVQMRRKERE